MAVLEPLFKALNQHLWSRSIVFELRETTVRVASIPDLIHLKRLAGRPLDQDDIEHLEVIVRAKKNAATPAQRLEWPEEMLELAYRAGALGPRQPECGPS